MLTVTSNDCTISRLIDTFAINIEQNDENGQVNCQLVCAHIVLE
jgi:hypothetical protein